MVNSVAVGYENIMAMLILNVALSTDITSAVKFLHLNSHNTFNSHLN